MMGAAHRVMVLIEAIESEGKPTLEQVEAAIMDESEGIRKLEEVFSDREIITIANGGNAAINQANKIFNLAEHYRLELIRVMQYAHRELGSAHKNLTELQEKLTTLDARVKHLVSELHEAEQQWPKSG